jgi:DNA-binding transcriptional regulator YiaG
MSPLAYIRRDILGLSQAAFAVIVKTSQATVSRWETGELEPDREQLRLIRQAVRARRLRWHDKWFFERPDEAA